MCNFLLSPPVDPPNERCSKFVVVLKVFCGLEFIIMVSAFATGAYNHAIFSIVFMPLLFCSWRSIEHETLTIYMYCSILLYVTDLIYILGKYPSAYQGFKTGPMCARRELSAAVSC